jgi:uncharacterized protein
MTEPDVVGKVTPAVELPPAEESPGAPAAPEPVTAAERISSVDVIRGFALLGILVMNIVGFGFHPAAYGDPTVQGGSTGANLWIYLFNMVLVDGKMRGIFSMVFGAGVFLLTTRLEQRGAPAADIHYRRMLWLMLFGIVHAYLLWWGEILYPYALLGLALYPFRRLSTRGLLIFAAALVIGTTGFFASMAFHLRSARDKAAAADAAAAKGAKLTEEQIDAQKEWKDKLKDMKPGPEEIKKMNEGFGGGFAKVFKARAGIVMHWHSLPYYSPMMWDLLSMMLLGMALIKMGALSAKRSFVFYARMALVGYAIGIPLHLYTAWSVVTNNFEPIRSSFAWTPYQPARIAVCLGHVAVLMMIMKAGALRWLTSALAAVGQMAFTNYVSQSVICSTLFYGYGFGLYAKLQRYQLYYVVLAIWIFQLVTSPIWLRHFRFGPLEWCWRSLTYWRRQPMRIERSQPDAEIAAAPAL